MTPTLLAGFTLAPTWLRGWAWRRDDSRIAEVFRGGPITDAIIAAERSGYDFAFRPDAMELDPTRIAFDGGQMGIDPLIQLAALAGVTSRIGLVATISATYADPYTIARQLTSLEHLAGPRIGWNLVTSLGGASNHSAPRGEDSASRWARAREFVDVVEGLRQGFPESALLRDRGTGRFSEADAIVQLGHVGEHFSVRGPMPTPAPYSRRLPLLQAGGSPSGRDFAARVADAVFTAAPDGAVAAELRHDLASRATGRPRALVLPGLSLFLAETRAEAAHLHRAGQSPATLSRRREAVGRALGVDLSDHAEDAVISRERLGPEPTGDGDRRLWDDARGGMRLGAILTSPAAVADLHWTVVGTIEDAVTAISERLEDSSIDGYIAFPGGSWDSVERACAVLPALRTAGYGRTDHPLAG